ncbi:class I SAM-dependent methyltransferase [Streptomyces sp. NPDC001393]
MTKQLIKDRTMTTSTPPEPVRGASRDDIALHYDLPTDFWRLWLDPSLTYSAALWDGIGGDPSDTEVLHAAQSAKNRAHLTWAGVGTGTHLLDIGCGWGALLAEAAQRGAVATGLTLSQSQAQNIWDRRLSGVEVLLQDWRDHTPSAPYDAIVSVGAFEHITRPGLTTGERIHAYTDFFARCYDWSEPGTRMSLQTVGLDQRTEKDEGRAAQFCSREIFPASALPRLSEPFPTCCCSLVVGLTTW